MTRTWAFLLALVMGFTVANGTLRAQDDDLDFEALLNDLTDKPAAEDAVEQPPAKTPQKEMAVKSEEDALLNEILSEDPADGVVEKDSPDDAIAVKDVDVKLVGDLEEAIDNAPAEETPEEDADFAAKEEALLGDDLDDLLGEADAITEAPVTEEGADGEAGAMAEAPLTKEGADEKAEELTEEAAAPEGNAPDDLLAEDIDGQKEVDQEAPVAENDVTEAPVVEEQDVDDMGVDPLLGGVDALLADDGADLTKDNDDTEEIAPVDEMGEKDDLLGVLDDEQVVAPEDETPTDNLKMMVDDLEAKPEADEMAEDHDGMGDVEEVENVPAAVTSDDSMKQAALSLAQQEEIRRQANEKEGRMALDRALAAMDKKDYATADTEFKNSLAKLPERAATVECIELARTGVADANYMMAHEIYRTDLKDAQKYIATAIKYRPDHKGALALQKKLTALEDKRIEKSKIPIPPGKRADYIDKRKSIADLTKEGEQYYNLGEYVEAEAIFNSVLQKDNYNKTAMRWLKRIEEKRYDIHTLQRDSTVAQAMREVRDSWNRPIREEVDLPDSVRQQEAIEIKSDAEKLREKMSEIIIPSIEFRQANISDVVNFLVEESVRGDVTGDGVNIVLQNNQGGGSGNTAAAPEPAQDNFGGGFDDFGGGFDDFNAGGDSSDLNNGGGEAPAANSNIPTITLNLRRISLMDALKIITEVAGLKYRIDGKTVMVTPAGYAIGPIITQMYPVQPSILDVVVERSDQEQDRNGEFVEMGKNANISRGDVKEFFTRAGVPFPTGSSITYNAAISQLIVANTAENLEIFERILSQLNVIPNQIEIEARFVEIAQQDIEEFGLEWILTDNWELAYKQGNTPVGGTQRIQMDANSAGITGGNRNMVWDNTTGAISPATALTQGTTQSLGAIASFSSILTNPELQMVVHALDQNGHSDLLSAPRVTTRSGVNAQIQVVQEIIYPTEFEVTQPTIQGEGALVTPPTVTPGGFETRETGVILNVTPTVGPDGYTIDLTLIPEVAELVDWLQYGSAITLPETDALGNHTGDRTYTYNIPQPVFHSRNVTTSIVIWDGQTVVMGGLIREELTNYEDKIPLLGDIPLLGRLFRTKGQNSQKKNLLIFVTARLVDPAGKPIHKAEAMNMGGDEGAVLAH